jgi:hypothetical protein
MNERKEIGEGRARWWAPSLFGKIRVLIFFVFLFYFLFKI